MIRVLFRGGMGNQMFQYAAGLNLALRHKTELLLDTTLVDDRFPRKEITSYKFSLDTFALEPRFTAISRLAHRFPIPGAWLGLDLAKIEVEHALGMRKLVRENTAWEPEKIGANATLFGYFQSENYFKENAEAVRRAFAFREALRGEAEEVARAIQSPKITAISLHVRRGDYVKFPSVAKIMGKVELSYFEDAGRYIAERVKNPHFFVFSNDAAWCKENMKLPFPATYVPASCGGPNGAWHFELMSLCKHNVITNSTYSWWAAWLNKNPGKIVAGPKNWFADPAREKGLFPAGWVRI